VCRVYLYAGQWIFDTKLTSRFKPLEDGDWAMAYLIEVTGRVFLFFDLATAHGTVDALSQRQIQKFTHHYMRLKSF